MTPLDERAAVLWPDSPAMRLAALTRKELTLPHDLIWLRGIESRLEDALDNATRLEKEVAPEPETPKEAA